VTAARLAARCVELLGTVDGPIAIDAPVAIRTALAARLPVASDLESAAAAVCVFLGEPIALLARGARLRVLAARMPIDAPLVVIDHNQPRTWWRRAVGAVVLMASGRMPSRARHPVAREVHDHGFVVERLRLAAGERVQLVLARGRPGSP
jgi:hypothetical protein